MDPLLIKQHPDSSQVIETRYNPLAQKLIILFRHENAEYEYSGVQPAVYEELTKARSIGKFVHLYIKPNFRYERIK
jgi:hypothetical protein